MMIAETDDLVCQVEQFGVAIDGTPPIQLVGGLSFRIHKGDYFALVGESGSGKSITCHSMMRLLPFRPRIDGRIIIDGQDVWSLDRKQLLAFRRTAVGMVFQDPLAALNPVRTIGSQMIETLKVHNPGSHYDDLRTLPDEHKNKMWLYHYNAAITEEQAAKAAEDGFAGYVAKGQSFEF